MPAPTLEQYRSARYFVKEKELESWLGREEFVDSLVGNDHITAVYIGKLKAAKAELAFAQDMLLWRLDQVIQGLEINE